MMYVRAHTTIPVPAVYAFDSSGDNPLGLEWILMEKIEGHHYWAAGTEVPAQREGPELLIFNSKIQKKVVGQIAKFNLQLCNLPIPGAGQSIGNLFYRWSDSDDILKDEKFILGPLVDRWFGGCWRRISYNVNRGP